MFLLTLLELMGAGLVIALAITQVALPLANRTMYFPMFRHKRTAQLEGELRQAQQDLHDVLLQSAIADVRRKTEGVLLLEEDLKTAQHELDDAVRAKQVEAIRRRTERVRGVEARLAVARDELETAEQEVQIKAAQVKAAQQRAAL